jgi:hypothetical protein
LFYQPKIKIAPILLTISDLILTQNSKDIAQTGGDLLTIDIKKK